MSRYWTKEELNAASKMMKQKGHMGFEEFCQAIEQKQPVSFNLREKDRKKLVKDISEILDEKAEYMRMPTCAYRIGDYTVAKDGTLTWETNVADADVLLQALNARGWGYSIVIENSAPEEPQPGCPSTDEEMPESEVITETAAPAEGNTDAESDTYDLCTQNARIAMDQEQYQKEFDELVERHSRVKQEYEEQEIAAEQDVDRVAQIDYFINTLEELDAPVTEFDEQLWISMVDHVVVHSKEDIRVVYRDGIEK